MLKPLVEQKGWFFTWRLKELESFALKIETGRVSNPVALEDFFACTIVVPTLSRIGDAEQLITTHFDFRERRPPDDSQTSKRSSSFPFDDLRLYVARRPAASGRDADLDGTVFEVQIKTVLQYAWIIATHDLIYKTNTVSWPKERIAFQIKAMLEHAEIAIAAAEQLSDSPSVAKKDKWTDNIIAIINQIECFWPEDQFPEDRKRLAENIFGLLRTADLPANRLVTLLEAEKSRNGMIPTDLSPYAFTVQALAHYPGIKFEEKFKRSRIKTKIVIHDGMDIPTWMKQHSRVINLNAFDFPPGEENNSA